MIETTAIKVTKIIALNSLNSTLKRKVYVFVQALYRHCVITLCDLVRIENSRKMLSIELTGIYGDGSLFLTLILLSKTNPGKDDQITSC